MAITVGKLRNEDEIMKICNTSPKGIHLRAPKSDNIEETNANIGGTFSSILRYST